MRFLYWKGWMLVAAPDGLTTWTPAGARSDNALIKALANADRWKRLLESGGCASVAGLADSEKVVNPSSLRGVLRLSLLAPNIVEATGARARVTACAW